MFLKYFNKLRKVISNKKNKDKSLYKEQSHNLFTFSEFFLNITVSKIIALKNKKCPPLGNGTKNKLDIPYQNGVIRCYMYQV